MICIVSYASLAVTQCVPSYPLIVNLHAQRTYSLYIIYIIYTCNTLYTFHFLSAVYEVVIYTLPDTV